MTETAEKNITQELKREGYTLEVESLDSGSDTRASIWSVTLKRNGQSFTTQYTMGAAHRRFKTREECRKAGRVPSRSERPGPLRPDRPFPFGERVPYKSTATLHDEASRKRFTIPIEPTLTNVLHAFIMDASGVRDGQTLNEFSAEFGYTDIENAVKAYEGCKDEFMALAYMGADFDKLNTLFQDY